MNPTLPPQTSWQTASKGISMSPMRERDSNDITKTTSDVDNILKRVEAFKTDKVAKLHDMITTLLKGSTELKHPPNLNHRYEIYQISGLGPNWQKREPRPETEDPRDYMLKQRDLTLSAIENFFQTSGLIDPKTDFYFDMTQSILEESLQPEYASVPTNNLLLDPLIIILIFHGTKTRSGPSEWPDERLKNEFRTRSLTFKIQGFNDRRLGGSLLPTFFKGLYKPDCDPNRPVDSPSAYNKLVYLFKPRPDNSYPEYRLKLFLLLLLPELLLLLEKWESIRTTTNQTIITHISQGRRAEAEAAVQTFITSCLFETGTCRKIFQRIEFFTMVIHYVNKARAPSVDANIYKYLYGVPGAGTSTSW